jgi:hypothetical protein
LPPQLTRIHRAAAGIDSGAESHFVCMPADRDEQPMREFGGFTDDLYQLADLFQYSGWIGKIEPNLTYPRDFEIDYVRVYARDNK